jgi:hypothetical protein
LKENDSEFFRDESPIKPGNDEREIGNSPNEYEECKSDHDENDNGLSPAQILIYQYMSVLAMKSQDDKCKEFYSLIEKFKI